MHRLIAIIVVFFFMVSPALAEKKKKKRKKKKNADVVEIQKDDPKTGDSKASDTEEESAGDEKTGLAEPQTSDEGTIHPPVEGFAYPYSYENLMRGFDGGSCHHQALDIGGVGENAGVGTPIYAIVEAKVTFIGLPADNPKKYGTLDKRKGKERRGDDLIPRKIEVDGYGTVYPFTRKSGSSRTGVYIRTSAKHPDIEGYAVRYMHLAAVHPDLKVGDIVQPGQEIGLMGATGFDDTRPHLHLDIEDLDEVRVDPAPFIGMQEVRPSKCKPINKKKKKKRKGKKGKKKKIRYKVKKGDTLSRIAKKYKVRKKDIVRWNKLKDPDKLRTGQKLKIYR